MWSCPEGYLKMWEKCVRMSRTRKNYVDADSDCSAEGATLVRPQTRIEVCLLVLLTCDMSHV